MKNTANPLQLAIKHANEQGRMALIPYITAGFPDKDTFFDRLEEIDRAGADIIEIGVPFSDPVADGPLIEQAARHALTDGVSLPWILDELKKRRGQCKAPLLLMGYVNPFFRYGPECLLDDAEAANVAGFIVPDMPLEESGMLRGPIGRKGQTLITLVAPNTTESRMRKYLPYTQGFVYVMSMLGTTGGIATVEQSVANTLRLARYVFDVPLALGFGLHTPRQLDALPPNARPNAVVLGSALLRHIREGGKVADFFKDWKNASF